MEGLELHLANSVDSRDHGFLADLLNTTWGGDITADMMAARLDSGALFLIAYSEANQRDIEYLSSSWGREVGRGQRIPIGIVQTTDLITRGEYGLVPQEYRLLTMDGFWKPLNHKSDTLILADVTMLHSRRGRHGNGEARHLVTTAKNLASTMYRHIWTYTPDILAVKRWHQSMGARDTRFRIPDARPGYAYPDVNLMDYSLF